MRAPEIDEGSDYIGFKEALEIIYNAMDMPDQEEVPLESCINRITAQDLAAVINNPSQDVSLKDGFAVRSADVERATPQSPVKLQLIGSAFAGQQFAGKVCAYQAVVICSGGPIPVGAEAVVSSEFCSVDGTEVLVAASAEPGRNILRAGEDAKAGTIIVAKDSVILPGCMGLIAAAGIQRVRVYRRPKVAAIAVGDEVVAPGGHLKEGQLYASNLVTISAWLTSFGIPHVTSIVGDNQEAIEQEIRNKLRETDVIITSGGAWGSERDLVIKTLDEMGWEKHFHYVRMGPGKGIAFGLADHRAVFCLPGGPASNEMAFIQLALPGILRKSGMHAHPLQTIKATLTDKLVARNRAWTEFRDAVLSCKSGVCFVSPYRSRSRLQAIAHSDCLICIPEGKDHLMQGDEVSVQILAPANEYLSRYFTFT